MFNKFRITARRIVKAVTPNKGRNSWQSHGRGQRVDIDLFTDLGRTANDQYRSPGPTAGLWR